MVDLVCTYLHVIQGAADGGGFLVGQSSLATLDGDTLQNNGIGLLVTSRSSARLGGQFRNFIARGNGRGIQMNRTAFVYVGAVVENSTDVGAAVIGNSSLVITGSISGSGSAGVLVRESSFARFDSASISGNAGGGVFLKDLSMGDFINGSTVTGNVGTDVFCSPQFAATRGTGSIGGGTTNCIEP
jgi:Right handed beta helix region